MFNRFRIFVVSLVLLFSAQCYATSSSVRSYPEEVVHGAATHLIEQLTVKRDTIQDNQAIVNRLVRNILFPIVDTKRMARFAMGKHWNSTNKSQKREFVVAFQKLLLKTYSTAFANFHGEHVVFGVARYNKKRNKAIVRGEIFRESGAPVIVDFKLYITKDKTWKVYDAVVDGVEIVKTFRLLFDQQIQREGFDKMLGSLNQRVKYVVMND